jgi:hypothetical protein
VLLNIKGNVGGGLEPVIGTLNPREDQVVVSIVGKVVNRTGGISRFENSKLQVAIGSGEFIPLFVSVGTRGKATLYAPASLGAITREMTVGKEVEIELLVMVQRSERVLSLQYGQGKPIPVSLSGK